VRAAQAPPIVTDGSFTPDGRRVVLRTYGSAVVYDASTWDELWSDDLPPQPQGESLTVEPDGDSFLIGSEGSPSTVLRLDLPEPERTQKPQTRERDHESDVSEAEADLDLWLKVLAGLVVVLVL